MESAPFRGIFICITFPSCTLHNCCFPIGLFRKWVFQFLEGSRICERVGRNEHLSRCTGARGGIMGTRLAFTTGITTWATTITVPFWMIRQSRVTKPPVNDENGQVSQVTGAIVELPEGLSRCRLSKLRQLRTDIVPQTTCLSFHE